MMTISIDSIVARWTDPSRRPLFKGGLVDISPDGTVCRCAQGDILHLAGWSDGRLASADQSQADAEVAALLGISRTHSVLLRYINDDADGCPQDVLAAPEKILGPHARLVLAFWHHLDTMTADDWHRVAVAWTTAWTAGRVTARDVAWTTPGIVARDVTCTSVRTVCSAKDAAYAARNAAAAANEIQGHEIFAERGWPFVFLPMFDLTIDDLRAA